MLRWLRTVFGASVRSFCGDIPLDLGRLDTRHLLLAEDGSMWLRRSEAAVRQCDFLRAANLEPAPQLLPSVGDRGALVERRGDVRPQFAQPLLGLRLREPVAFHRPFVPARPSAGSFAHPARTRTPSKTARRRAAIRSRSRAVPAEPSPSERSDVLSVFRSGPSWAERSGLFMALLRRTGANGTAKPRVVTESQDSTPGDGRNRLSS